LLVTWCPKGKRRSVVGGLSACRYNPSKVGPGGFHSPKRVSLVTSLPFAIAQHPHHKESERWLLPLPPLPAGRAGWGTRADRPMKPAAPRLGSGQRQGNRARTHRHTHTLSSVRARTHTCTRTLNTAPGGKNTERTGPSQDRLRIPLDQGQQAKRTVSFSHSSLSRFL
jgi:hypothetical protein